MLLCGVSSVDLEGKYGKRGPLGANTRGVSHVSHDPER